MLIKFKKKSLIIVLIYMQVLLPSLLRGVCVNFGIPLSIPLVNYTLQGLILVLFMLNFRRSNARYISRNWIFIFLGICLIILCSFMNFLIGGIPLKQYVKGLFDFLHMITFMIIVMCVVDFEDYNKVGNLVIWIVIINAVFMVYQYIFMGLIQDKLGGIFGNSNGSNGIENTFFCIGLIILIVRCLYNEIKISKLLMYCLITACIAGLAEITIYFFEMGILIFAAIILNKQDKIKIKAILKSLAIIIGFSIVAIIGFKVLVILFPTKARFLKLSNVLEYIGASKGTTGVYEISRARAIQQMSDMFLNNTYNKLLGLGIGYTVEGSHFFYLYSNLQYQWFSTAITVLESGYFGIIIRISIFIFIFIKAGKIKKRTENIELKKWSLIAQLMSIFTVILFFYNNTIENKYDSFLLGFFLASYGCYVKKREFSQRTTRKK